MKLKPKHMVWAGLAAFIAFKVFKDKAGGDCGCGGGKTRGSGPVATTAGAR